MQDKTVGLVTYTRLPHLTKSDILLIPEFKKKGIHATPVAWDDKDVNWNQFSTLILRSCWNYHLNDQRFIQWLSMIRQKGIQLLNPFDVVCWNIHKKYLLELEQKGVSIVPASIVPKQSLVSLHTLFDETSYEEIIVKPAIGASGSGILRIRKHDKKSEKLFQKLLSVSDCLIQPYIKESHHVEISVVFFGKTYSHSIFRHSKKLFTPHQSIINQAKSVVNAIPNPLLYARVDGLIIQGKFLLMELELIEPELFFDIYPKGAEAFVECFMKIIT